MTAKTRTNNFDALRLLGAMAVILGHAYYLMARPLEVPVVLGYQVQALGVVIFFCISGYLITASWTRNSDLLNYLAARCLRIFPALIALVLVTVFLIGPLLTTLSTSDYLQDPRARSYLSNIWLLTQYDLPGVLAGAPYPVAINGSLWTLVVEFFCYLALPILCLAPHRLRPLTLATVIGLSLYLASVPVDLSPIIYGFRLKDAAGMWVFFATGALLRLIVERWPGAIRADVAVALLALYSVTIGTLPSSLGWVSWIVLPYVVLTIGLASTPVVRAAARFGDVSYGLYLYAFPVQQIAIYYWGAISMGANLTLVTVITLVLASLSWHLVEYPSLILKERLKRRRQSRSAPVPLPSEPDTRAPTA